MSKRLLPLVVVAVPLLVGAGGPQPGSPASAPASAPVAAEVTTASTATTASKRDTAASRPASAPVAAATDGEPIDDLEGEPAEVVPPGLVFGIRPPGVSEEGGPTLNAILAYIAFCAGAALFALWRIIRDR